MQSSWQILLTRFYWTVSDHFDSSDSVFDVFLFPVCVGMITLKH